MLILVIYLISIILHTVHTDAVHFIDQEVGYVLDAIEAARPDPYKELLVGVYG